MRGKIYVSSKCAISSTGSSNKLLIYRFPVQVRDGTPLSPFQGEQS